MTQSITTDPNQPDGYFNESAMVGMLGYALFMAFQLAVIFGPELALTNTATAFDFCFQRFVALRIVDHRLLQYLHFEWR